MATAWVVRSYQYYAWKYLDFRIIFLKFESLINRIVLSSSDNLEEEQGITSSSWIVGFILLSIYSNIKKLQITGSAHYNSFIAFVREENRIKMVLNLSYIKYWISNHCKMFNNSLTNNVITKIVTKNKILEFANLRRGNTIPRYISTKNGSKKQRWGMGGGPVRVPSILVYYIEGVED